MKEEMFSFWCMTVWCMCVCRKIDCLCVLHSCVRTFVAFIAWIPVLVVRTKFAVKYPFILFAVFLYLYALMSLPKLIAVFFFDPIASVFRAHATLAHSHTDH